jgi:ribosome-associated translation inhibitor RaiA
MKEYSIEEIDLAIDVLDNIRESAIANTEYGFNDDWVTFMKKMRILTAQSSGARIQNYIFHAFGWAKINPLLNRGDVKNSLGQYYEVKVTIITTSNPCANIVQIRLWQNISGHHIFVVDAMENYKLTHFALSSFDMKQEVALCGVNAHGTKETNKSNQKVEWAIRIKWKENDIVYKRWTEKYKQNSEIVVSHVSN